MSRYTIQNDRFTVYFGVDQNVDIGVFFQIYRRHPACPAEDIPVVDGDNRGIQLLWSLTDLDEFHDDQDDIVWNDAMIKGMESCLQKRDAKIRELLGTDAWHQLARLRHGVDLANDLGSLYHLSSDDIMDIIRHLGFTRDQFNQPLINEASDP